MISSLATIHIKDLRLRTFIGFNEEERVEKQDVCINIRLQYDVSEARVSDAVEDACDYKVLTKQVITLVENNSFNLLEKMAGDILAIFAADPKVKTAQVEIDKPHALRFADSVSLCLNYQADD